VLAIPSAVLTAVTFAAAISAFAATQDTDAKFALVFRLGVIPLFLFSGTFFPISQLPDWAEPISRLSPLYYGVDLCRMFTTGEPRWDAAALDVGALFAVLAVGWMVGTRTFTRRLTA
jgi:lipooligosaccharide transport system permease protein